jgi:hypothetical protein
MKIERVVIDKNWERSKERGDEGDRDIERVGKRQRSWNRRRWRERLRGGERSLESAEWFKLIDFILIWFYIQINHNLEIKKLKHKNHSINFGIDLGIIKIFPKRKLSELARKNIHLTKNTINVLFGTFVL